MQNHLTSSVIRCTVYPVKGRVELCGAGWLISLFSIRFEDTATEYSTYWLLELPMSVAEPLVPLNSTVTFTEAPLAMDWAFPL